MRMRYGYNCQWANASVQGQVVPLNYMQVVPGDSVSGKSTIHIWTDTTVRPWMNKMYLDVFAFYVPFRLLWDDFPNFVRGNDRDGYVQPNMPTVGNVFEFNYEHQLSASDPGILATTNNALQRRAYNLIGKKFFDLNDDITGDATETGSNELEAAVPIQSSYRASTFFESAEDSNGSGDDSSITIDTSDASTELYMDNIREASRQNTFSRLKSFYGSRYVDYLAQLGVSTKWSILDEPELIGKKSMTVPMQLTNATSEGTGFDIGTPKGQWKASISLGLKKTFCAEHGFVVMVGVTRLDGAFAEGQPPHLSYQNREDFWSPEFETGRMRSWNNAVWGGPSAGTVDFWTQQYRELQVGLNVVAMPTGSAPGTNEYIYIRNDPASFDADGFKNTNLQTGWSTNGGPFDGTFANVPGEGYPADTMWVADHNLVKESNVRRNPTRKPLT